ncbi:MAG: phosphoribosyltransferase [Bacteroidetes bacterium]|nr:phosphoribosyltransferase [Bacteroidota bacterium]
MFRDRIDAAKQLAIKLKNKKIENGIVLAVPRGGVPVGYEIAKSLHLPLEVFLSKKIGHPNNPEFAIGSVTLSGIIVNENTMNADQDYIIRQSKKIQGELKERFKIFMDGKRPTDLKRKTVILTDDGVATGSTLISAVEAIRKSSPKKIIIAVPLSPPETASKLKQIVDEFICLATPFDFLGVAQYYYNFSQVEDKEVIQILKQASNRQENVIQ